MVIFNSLFKKKTKNTGLYGRNLLSSIQKRLKANENFYIKNIIVIIIFLIKVIKYLNETHSF